MTSINKKIVSLLKRKKFKIAVAESCTGGMLSSAITSVSGSSKIFTMGVVTYSNQVKSSLLKVSQKIIKKIQHLAFTDKVKIIFAHVPEKTKLFIEKNFQEELEYFQKKYSFNCYFSRCKGGRYKS